MSERLPRLRADIDAMPSPLPDQPGLLLRDPMGFTEDVLVVPPPWLAVLACFDGEHTVLDAQAMLTRAAGGEIVGSEDIRQLAAVLSRAGYVEDDALEERRERAREAFRSAPERLPMHAGSAYPAEPGPARAEMAAKLAEAGAESPARWPLAVAAPHVSPEGGYASYAAAYTLPPLADERTFVILGTSHYGPPDRFGTTAKPFRTPFGAVEVDQDALKAFAAGARDAVEAEDYCHRVEHSIELQVLFLQHRLDRPFRILPILCGPFAESLRTGDPPEKVEGNRRVFDALAELQAKRDDLVWVLGVDMAHVGVRYGHREPVTAYEGVMAKVRAQDERRMERLCGSDASGFFDLVHPGRRAFDELSWCGTAPFYTFLKSAGAAAELSGEVRSYEQWNIDERSVVSFAGMHFHRRG